MEVETSGTSLLWVQTVENSKSSARDFPFSPPVMLSDVSFTHGKTSAMQWPNFEARMKSFRKIGLQAILTYNTGCYSI